MNTVSDNLESLNQRIKKAADGCGRDISDIHLVAVSKKQPDERIQAALDAGQRCFGENRVQEAIDHWKNHRNQYPDLQLHLIGPLQTNKIKEAVTLFDVIETIDRPKLVDALVKEMSKQEKKVQCFVQVNIGEEDQKSGVSPTELPALLSHCQDVGLKIEGLMCIPPANEPPALHFALFKKLADDQGLSILSMGMSGDFEKAIPLGATHVRIGTALFGPRG